MPDEYASGGRGPEVTGKTGVASRRLGSLRVGYEFALMGCSETPVVAARWRLPISLAAAALALSGCAHTTQTTSRGNSKEYFPSSVYGPASPRLIADGQPVPKGGGQYLVGNPYHVAGRTYYPAENTHYSAVGMASWYGDAFHGRRTANGEIYDMHGLTAAHPTMPLPSYARVTNLTNGYSVIVRVNDRGPYHGGRVMDVSSRVADVLGFKGEGTAKIKVDYVGRAPMEGSDDRTLLASLRTDGSPADLDGYAVATMVADAAPAAAPTIFSLFSSSSSTTTVARSAPAPAPAPEPTPQESSAVAAVEAPKPKIAHPPTPPDRPFDLSSARRDALMRLASAPLPPTRITSGGGALYFATPPKPSRDPLVRLLKRAAIKPLDSDD